MWLVKQAASKVKSLSNQVLREKSQAQKLVEDVVSNRHEVMPVRKMGELASLSFEGDSFAQVVEFVGSKLADIRFERKSLKKRLNLIVLAVYLLKHGASGFIDQFRAMTPQLKRYEDLRNFVAEEDGEMRATIQELRDRSAYLLALLYDKAALLREKQVARLIREKLFLHSGDNSRQQHSGDNSRQQHSGDYSRQQHSGDYSRQQHSGDNSRQQHRNQENGDKGRSKDRVEQFLQHYVWRYTQRLDRKLDEITDILIAKIDEYLDGDMPQNFEIEQAELNTENSTFTKSEFQLGGEAARQQEAKFIDEKLQIKERGESRLETIEQNLLQLQAPPKLPPPDLILFQAQSNSKQNDKTQSSEPPPSSPQNKPMDDSQIQAFRSQLSSPPVASPLQSSP